MAVRVPAAVRAPIGFSVDDTDRLPGVTFAAVAGLVLGGAMAVFGLPPIDLHGPLHYQGIMDPLCGATRSVWSAMSGDLAMSWRYNPIGIPLVLGAAAALVRGAVGVTTKRWANVRVRSPWTVAGVAAVLAVALEIRQQLNADLVGPRPGETFSPVDTAIGLGFYAAILGAYGLNRLLVHRFSKAPKGA